ncbi:MAG: amino acid ABC transporter permease [Betaproteobacteria bacterium]|nr:amino acid ABC transporter permease [Betaproteobacteria bacterium]
MRLLGPRAWLARNLFPDRGSSLATLIIAALVIGYFPALLDWAIFNAVFSADNAACRAVAHDTANPGACWGVVVEKYRLILFGRFPHADHWRPLVATLLVIAALVTSCLPRVWARIGMRWLAFAWLLVFAAFFLLMRGGIAGLAYVETARWGGLPLTLLLTTLCIAAAFPIAVLAALGRLSQLPAVRATCIAYIELVRGVPLISVLFMASFMFPLFLPPGMTPDVLLRVLAGITLFAAAYLAEVVRGGLQAIPRGQHEAAASLGLTYWQTQRRILLPQALRHVVPAIVNSFISTFKDTSLVTIVSLYELTGALGLALRGDTDWRPFHFEGYLFIAAIYWVGCNGMSAYSRWVERRLEPGHRAANAAATTAAAGGNRQ